MSFNADRYRRFSEGLPPQDETDIRALVKACGGQCGEVETGRSELIYHDHRVVSINRYLPIYHAEDFDRRVPVETVYLSSELEVA